MGAAHAVNATAVDVPAAVAELTGGRGADVAFEVVGHGDTVATAIRSVRKGGTVVAGRQPVADGRAAAAGGRHAARSRSSGRAHRAARSPSASTCWRAASSTSIRSSASTAPLDDGPGAVRAAVQRRPEPDEGDHSAMSGFDLTGKRGDRHRREPRAGQTFARALARAGADLVITSRTLDSLTAVSGRSRVARAPRRAAGARRPQRGQHPRDGRPTRRRRIRASTSW